MDLDLYAELGAARDTIASAIVRRQPSYAAAVWD